jgi:hypothetical protein
MHYFNFPIFSLTRNGLDRVPLRTTWPSGDARDALMDPFSTFAAAHIGDTQFRNGRLKVAAENLDGARFLPRGGADWRRARRFRRGPCRCRRIGCVW